ncbi:MAG: hypothetical protein AAF799_37930 [Myxococcota bacterium]
MSLVGGCLIDPNPASDAGESSSGTSGSGTDTAPLPTSTAESTTDSPTTSATDDPTTSAADSTTASPEDTTAGTGECGDGVLDDGEECDGDDLGGEDCTTQGFDFGDLACAEDCTFDSSACGTMACNDGMITGLEVCDGMDLAGQDCITQGFEGGTLACEPMSCQTFDTSGCFGCGDGVTNGTEECDGVDLAGETCMSQGFGGGTLACAADCTLVVSSCDGYFEDFEDTVGVMPAALMVGVTAPWYVDDVDPIDGIYSARSGPLPGGGFTDLTIDADFAAAGSISFDYLTSCDNGFDFLEFRIDGVLDLQATGVAPLANHLVPVPAGMHTFSWRFNRQAFGNEGLDAVFLDNITLLGGAPI